MERPGRIKGVGQMRLTVQQITLPDGRSLPAWRDLDDGLWRRKREGGGDEGLVKGPSSHGPDIEEIGAGPRAARCWD